MANEGSPVEITVTREAGRMRVRMQFPLQADAGRRSAAGEKRGPATFVRTVVIERAGTPILVAHLGPGMVRRPEFTVDLEGAASGERLKLIWNDNAGKQYEQVFPAV